MLRKKFLTLFTVSSEIEDTFKSNFNKIILSDISI